MRTTSRQKRTVHTVVAGVRGGAVESLQALSEESAQLIAVIQKRSID